MLQRLPTSLSHFIDKYFPHEPDKRPIKGAVYIWQQVTPLPTGPCHVPFISASSVMDMTLGNPGPACLQDSCDSWALQCCSCQDPQSGKRK